MRFLWGRTSQSRFYALSQPHANIDKHHRCDSKRFTFRIANIMHATITHHQRLETTKEERDPQASVQRRADMTTPHQRIIKRTKCYVIMTMWVTHWTTRHPYTLTDLFVSLASYVLASAIFLSPTSVCAWT